MKTHSLQCIIFIIMAYLLLLSSCRSDNLFQDTSQRKIEKAIENKSDMIVFYGQDLCGTCVSYMPLVNEAAKSLNKKVHYLDADKYYGSEFLKKYDIELSPSLIIIEDGVLTKYEGNYDIETTKKIMAGNHESIKERFDELATISYETLVFKMSQKLDFILYIGRPDCPDCQKFEPILNEFISSNKKSGVYYLNIKEFRDNTLGESPGAQDIAFYEGLKSDFDIQWVPSVYHIVNGEITSKYQYLNSEYYSIEADKERLIEEERFLNEFIEWMQTNLV